MRCLLVGPIALWVGLSGCGTEGASSGPAAGAPSAGSPRAGGGSDQGPHGGSSGAPLGGTGSGSTASSGAGGAAGGGGGAGSGGEAGGALGCRTKGDGKSTITLVNHCEGTLSFRGSDIEGGDLLPGEHACRDVGSDAESIPAIRFWGFIGADPGGERYTLAELTLNTDFNDFDWYNISHVDASNLPMQVSAVEMPQCRTLSCPNSLLPSCPTVGQVKDSSGQVISCYSPSRDDENSTVAVYFEESCNDAYSWSGDDQDSVVACAGEDYDVVFCP